MFYPELEGEFRGRSRSGARFARAPRRAWRWRPRHPRRPRRYWPVGSSIGNDWGLPPEEEPDGDPWLGDGETWEVGAPAAQSCLARVNFEIFDFFSFNSAVLRSFHHALVRDIARRIVASARS